MYLDLDQAPVSDFRPTAVRAATWSVLVPFFNEADYLEATIASLATQTVAFRLILVDNGSTDGSAAIARDAAERHGLDYLLITERTPGKVAALRTGPGWVRSTYVATCDADTLYPSQYLAAAEALLAKPGCVVAGAYFVAPGTGDAKRNAYANGFLTGARILSRQCHAGGAGQAFDVATLRAAGGFDSDRWSYVLEDHEVINRTMKHGTMRYSREMWCAPSERPRDRASIRWTLVERLMYAAAAPVAGDWFFYSFLARRLAKRQLSSDRIRERPFQGAEGTAFASTYPVR
jgi:glycosyltransferase involved in cell wall biosynthesis